MQQFHLGFIGRPVGEVIDESFEFVYLCLQVVRSAFGELCPDQQTYDPLARGETGNACLFGFTERAKKESGT